MDSTEKLSITVTAEQAEFVRQRLESGRYESLDALVSDALLGLAAAERHPLPDDILGRLVDEAARDPQSHSSSEVHRALLDHHQRAVASGQGKIAS